MIENNQGLESLMIWQKSIDFAVDVCQNILPLFQPHEAHALSSQLRRAVYSISANIAEGYGRFSFQERIHFCYIARGSMAESKSFLVLAERLGYVNAELLQAFRSRLTELWKMLHGYINHLRKQKNQLNIKEVPDPDHTYDI
jgi:four helix bundle protein